MLNQAMSLVWECLRYCGFFFMMNAIVAKFSVHIWRLGSFKLRKNKKGCCN